MVYLDNAATSFPKPNTVIETVVHTVSHSFGTPGRGKHNSALRAAGAVDTIRKDLAKFFGVLEDFRVIFTYSATDALNAALKGFLNAGDHVVTTHMEHNSVSRPLKRMERDGFITLDFAECDSKGYVDIDDLISKMRSNTRLVAVNHGSNVLGCLQPITEIGRRVRDAGAYFLVDAAQTAGRVPISLYESNIDFLALAGHKGLFALQGTGALILGERVTGDRATGLRPFREGGTGFDSLSELQPVNWPEAFESGTHNVPGILSLGAGLDFVNSVGIPAIAEKEMQLLSAIWEGLSKYDNITLYGPLPHEPRVPLLSFNIKGWEPEDIGDILNQNHDIYVRTGLQCAPFAHKMMKTSPEGTVRVSPGYFNTISDVEKFLRAIRLIAETDVPCY